MCQSFRIPSCGFTTTCLSICQLLDLCLFLATSDCLEESCYDHPCVSPCVDGCSLSWVLASGVFWLCSYVYLTLEETTACPQSGCVIVHLQQRTYQSSHFCSSSPTRDVISLLNFCHFSGSSGVSYCSCASHFPDNY